MIMIEQKQKTYMNYMKKLKQEEKETANNPFADLLKDFK